MNETPVASDPQPDRGGKARGAYHHGHLRQALIAAALRALEEAPREAPSLSGLARALGVSQPAPYRHFADRDALLEAATLEGFRLFAEALDEAADRATASTLPPRLAEAHLAFGLTRGGLYRLMFIEPAAPGSPVAQARAREFARLEAAMRGMGFGQGSRRRALRFWAGVQGLILASLSPDLAEDLLRLSPSALVDDLVA